MSITMLAPSVRWYRDALKRITVAEPSSTTPGQSDRPNMSGTDTGERGVGSDADPICVWGYCIAPPVLFRPLHARLKGFTQRMQVKPGLRLVHAEIAEERRGAEMLRTAAQPLSNSASRQRKRWNRKRHRRKHDISAFLRTFFSALSA
jgi:hypothetical protein